MDGPLTITLTPNEARLIYAAIRLAISQGMAPQGELQRIMDLLMPYAHRT